MGAAQSSRLDERPPTKFPIMELELSESSRDRIVDTINIDVDVQF